MSKRYAKTPTVYQMEATECGAASLSMILSYYGCYVPLEKLRIETGVSRDGCNAKNILRAARGYGAETHGYKRDVASLLEMQPPFIIHWNFNHFVVFEGKRGKYVYINDPAAGRRKVTMEEFDDCFTGIVLTVAPTADFKKTKKPSSLLRVVRERLIGQYSSLALLIIVGVCLAVPGIAISVFAQVFTDDILLAGNNSWITALLIAMGGTVLLQMLLSWWRGLLLQKVQHKFVLTGAHSFISHMLRLPINFFDQRYAGDLSNRVDNSNTVNTFLAGELAETALNILMAVFYLILLLIYSPMLTLVGVVGTAVNVALVRLSAGVLSNQARKLQQDTGKLTGSLFSGLSITSTLKASGVENEYTGRILGYYAKNITTEQKMGRIQKLLSAVPKTAAQLSNVAVILVGGMIVIDGGMTVGMLVAFTALLGSFTEPIEKLVEFISKVHTIRADLGRVEDITNYQEDAQFLPHAEREDIDLKLNGSIEMHDISFGYSRLDEPLIRNFHFKLKSGSSVALVGTSGSGKSTVSKIASGLYGPWEGSVTIDGVPITEIPKEVLTSSVSTVSQDITIFSASVRDNITMWDRSIMEQDMVRAAKDACIHDVIAMLPGGYEYLLAENGTNLSGGQRQRMEIARALVTNPSILIMDEATSALDPIVEKQVLDNIKRRGCTCVIVAHRLSAIRDCDEIIVMERGLIVERGTHEELMATNGRYARLIQNV